MSHGDESELCAIGGWFNLKTTKRTNSSTVQVISTKYQSHWIAVHAIAEYESHYTIFIYINRFFLRSTFFIGMQKSILSHLRVFTVDFNWSNLFFFGIKMRIDLLLAKFIRTTWRHPTEWHTYNDARAIFIEARLQKMIVKSHQNHFLRKLCQSKNFIPFINETNYHWW